ncbi:hypothetical protein BDW59DRAFT_141023 [Aspergillus cavernicola]|uniref:DUF7136 domain-containing protein n=1 Tax=Aspergillus cavernicola TaxID=176166 RepID=A0ABR4IUD6_9EURO
MAAILFILAAALVSTSWAKYTHPFTPETIELDLAFPKNSTSAPAQDFPLIWGLQNSQLAWDMDVRLSWKLDRLDLPTETQTGLFPQQNYSTISSLQDNYTVSGPVPADPLILYFFPSSLRNFTVGQWKLSWKFGFQYTCSSTNISEQNYPYFDNAEPTELIFSIAEEGAAIDLLAIGNGSSSCPDTSTAITLEAIEFDQTVMTHGDLCPILNKTIPSATPCALRYNQSMVDEINAGAANNCSSEDWNRFVHTCQIGAGVWVVVPSGVTVLILSVFVLFVSIVSL